MSRRDQTKKFIFLKDFDKLKQYAVLSDVLENMGLIKLDPALTSTQYFHLAMLQLSSFSSHSIFCQMKAFLFREKYTAM